MNRLRVRLFSALTVVLALAMLGSCNRPPAAPPAPTGPEYCFEDVAYTYRVVVTDPNGDSVAARFDWGDTTESDWSGWFASGHAITMAHAWQDTGTYEVRAWGRDRGHTSVLSGGLVVRVVSHRPPGTPSEPSGPDEGEQNSLYSFASTALHPDNLPVAIRFSWGDGDTSDWSPLVAPGETARMSNSWSLPDTYAVTAQAMDTVGAVSNWSAPRTIVIRPDTLRWRFQTERAITSSPALGPDGTIYIGSNDGYLYAVRPQGILRWRRHTDGLVRFSPAVASDGTVYFGSDDGYVYAVAPDSTLKWRQSVGTYVSQSPAIGADGTVYVGAGDLFAFAPDGTPKWQYPLRYGIAGSPAIGPSGILYFGSYDSLLAVNADGSRSWGCRVGFPGPAALAADGTIYVGSRDSGLYALEPGGTQMWRCSLDAAAQTEPAVGADGTIYIGSSSGVLHAVHPDGTAWWSYVTDGPIQSTPAVAADGTLFFGSDDGYIYALNPDGSLRWKYLTENSVRSSPAIAPDGVMYVGSTDYYLYALWSPSPLADTPWPKFRHDQRNTGCIGGSR